eukprot:CAMPEP_0178916690 /NCGR_PEP_ID=MMETSP0786-20121207/12799_1 /TAXON_ID=186022 /ORGANISM="Thalassionema frauenfeldii, Strain CCMP 1798" /LENGTH=275 /DNA_ID=CAMNT_0020590093 /DNA_START=5 /DNA_END=832 /DNA_ORIENTATION=+
MNLVTFLASLVFFNLIIPYTDSKGYTRLGRTCDSLDTVERLDLTANAIFFSQKEVRQACDPDPFCSGYADLDGVFGLLDSIGSLSNILHSCYDGFEIWEKKTQNAHVSRGGEDCIDTHRYGDITSCRPFNLAREECDEVAAKYCCDCGGGEKTAVVTQPPDSQLIQIFEQIYEADDTTSLVLKNFDPDDLGFIGSIPSDIYQLTKLTKLDLSDNTFFGTIPSGIEVLTDLEELLITGNILSGKLPEGLAALENLKVVNIEFNGPLFGPGVTFTTP